MQLIIEQPEQGKIHTVPLKISPSKAVLIPEQEVIIGWTPTDKLSKEMWEQCHITTDTLVVPPLNPAIICTLKIGKHELKFNNNTYLDMNNVLGKDGKCLHTFKRTICVGSKKNIIHFSFIPGQEGSAQFKLLFIYFDKKLLASEPVVNKPVVTTHMHKRVGLGLVVFSVIALMVGIWKRK